MEIISAHYIKKIMTGSTVTLYPTHQKICIPIIERIYRKMQLGLQFPPIKINDQSICDGHHRYVASCLANYTIDMVAGGISPSTLQYKWEDTIFEATDWDTAGVIQLLNRKDAVYNELSLDALLKLLE